MLAGLWRGQKPSYPQPMLICPLSTPMNRNTAKPERIKQIICT
ncbi:hypothetical protein SFOMI_4262 [Sphingobium fuliginis]|uniref:Uncharacterized protein n=1 Tax=Sphingobium fuliginis (strain ATCC 27551) TaxID=336203 RepID=A0A292ZL51_SPHSA|nr:hypothetical protein SFOMI_4262 [Sphingobium fuliginis]